MYKKNISTPEILSNYTDYYLCTVVEEEEEEQKQISYLLFL